MTNGSQLKEHSYMRRGGVRQLRWILALVLALTGAAFIAEPASAAPACSLVSGNDNRYMRFDPTGYNRIVEQQTGGTGNGLNRLRAWRTDVNSISIFDLYFCTDASGGSWSIRSNTTGKWVTTSYNLSGNDSNLLRAISSTVGTNERYTLLDLTVGNYVKSQTVLSSTHHYALYSWSVDGSGHWVSARYDMTGFGFGNLRAIAATVNIWETITFG